MVNLKSVKTQDHMPKHSVSPIFGERFLMKSAISGIATVVMISFLSGCGRPVEDLSSSPKYNFDAFSGTVWKTKVKVAVADLNGTHPTPLKNYLLEPKAFDPNHPEYTPPPGGMRIIEVLPVGTRLCIEQLLMKKTFETNYAWVTASLDDGRVIRLSDAFLAKTEFSWREKSDAKDWGVNPDLLEKAE
jgi:hypothetical protein